MRAGSGVLPGLGHKSGKEPTVGSLSPQVLRGLDTDMLLPLDWSFRMAQTHEPLGSLNIFEEVEVLTFFPFHHRCCCDSQALVTHRPTARR